MPLVTLGQTRRSIRTKGSRQHVLVIVRIHDTTHPRNQTALPIVVTVKQSLTGSLVKCIVLHIVCRNILCTTTSLLVCGLFSRVHTDNIDMMLLSKGAIEGQQMFNCPVTSLVLVNRTRVDSLRILIVYTSTCETACLIVTEVQTNIDTIAQALNPRTLHLTKQCIVRTNTLTFVKPQILIVIHHILRDNRLVILRHSNIASDIAVSIIRTSQRTHRQNIVNATYALIRSIAIIGAQAKTEPLTNHLVEITTDRYTVVLFGRNH